MVCLLVLQLFGYTFFCSIFKSFRCDFKLRSYIYEITPGQTADMGNTVTRQGIVVPYVFGPRDLYPV